MRERNKMDAIERMRKTMRVVRARRNLSAAAQSKNVAQQSRQQNCGHSGKSFEGSLIKLTHSAVEGPAKRDVRFYTRSRRACGRAPMRPLLRRTARHDEPRDRFALSTPVGLGELRLRRALYGIFKGISCRSIYRKSSWVDIVAPSRRWYRCHDAG